MVHNGDMKANRGPQTGAAAPALLGSPSPVHPWHDGTTAGDILIFWEARHPLRPKSPLWLPSTITCYNNNTLPEEEHNGTPHLPTNEGRTPPIPRAVSDREPRRSTPPHCHHLPRDVLDLQCPKCGISNFSSPHCSTCGNKEWDTELCLDPALQVHIPETGSH